MNGKPIEYWCIQKIMESMLTLIELLIGDDTSMEGSTTTASGISRHVH